MFRQSFLYAFGLMSLCFDSATASPLNVARDNGNAYVVSTKAITTDVTVNVPVTFTTTRATLKHTTLYTIITITKDGKSTQPASTSSSSPASTASCNPNGIEGWAEQDYFDKHQIDSARKASTDACYLACKNDIKGCTAIEYQTDASSGDDNCWYYSQSVGKYLHKENTAQFFYDISCYKYNNPSSTKKPPNKAPITASSLSSSSTSMSTTKQSSATTTKTTSKASTPTSTSKATTTASTLTTQSSSASKSSTSISTTPSNCAARGTLRSDYLRDCIQAKYPDVTTELTCGAACTQFNCQAYSLDANNGCVLYNTPYESYYTPNTTSTLQIWNTNCYQHRAPPSQHTYSGNRTDIHCAMPGGHQSQYGAYWDSTIVVDNVDACASYCLSRSTCLAYSWNELYPIIINSEETNCHTWSAPLKGADWEVYESAGALIYWYDRDCAN